MKTKAKSYCTSAGRAHPDLARGQRVCDKLEARARGGDVAVLLLEARREQVHCRLGPAMHLRGALQGAQRCCSSVVAGSKVPDITLPKLCQHTDLSARVAWTSSVEDGPSFDSTRALAHGPFREERDHQVPGTRGWTCPKWPPHATTTPRVSVSTRKHRLHDPQGRSPPTVLCSTRHSMNHGVSTMHGLVRR